MVTLSLAVFAGIGVFAAAHWAVDFGWVGSVLWGVLGFGIVNFCIGFFVQRKMKAEMEKVQKILLGGQKELEAKMQRWRFRPPSSMTEAQREIAADTAVFVRKAIAQTEELRRFRLFIPMIKRQIATAQLQLYWMMKDFATVDRLLPQAIIIDPTMAAMKMARMYMRGEDLAAIAKVYEKAVRRVRYNGNVLPAAAMSWMQVQKGDLDGAFKTLTEALKKSDNEALKRNHEILMNNRPAHFNNSGIGDQWYSLFLEEPKMHAPRQRPVYR